MKSLRDSSHLFTSYHALSLSNLGWLNLKLFALPWRPVKTCEDLKKVFTLINYCITKRWTISVKSEDFFMIFIFSLLPSLGISQEVIMWFPYYNPMVCALHPCYLRPASLWFSACKPMLCALHLFYFQPSNTLPMSSLAHFHITNVSLLTIAMSPSPAVYLSIIGIIIAFQIIASV